MERINNINIEDGILAYTNFSGKKSESGKRTVTFVIPDDIAQDLIKDGWNLRLETFEKQPDRSPRYLLNCTIQYRTKDGRPKDPKIYLVRPNGLQHMTEETVDNLDGGVDILSVDAVIRPFYWEVGSRSGISAYINSMYITVKEEPVDAKYRKMLQEMNEDVSIDDLPFAID